MKKILTCLMIAAIFSGCLKGENECNYNECGFVAPASEIQMVQDYLTANGITATQHCSGLFYVIDQQGSGAKPTVCNAITVNYEGKLTNGNVFDQTQPGMPATFSLQGLITGFKNGIPLLNAGGKIRLFVPPSLGYGNQQGGAIPPNSVLIFSVDLLGVQ